MFFFQFESDMIILKKEVEFDMILKKKVESDMIKLKKEVESDMIILKNKVERLETENEILREGKCGLDTCDTLSGKIFILNTHIL